MTSRSAKAGLIFPISRIEKAISKKARLGRVSKWTAVYAAGAIEELTRAILERAAEVVKAANKKRVSREHLLKALSDDSDIARMRGNGAILFEDAPKRLGAKLKPKMTKPKKAA